MNNKNHQLMCVTSYLKTIAFKKSDNSYTKQKKKENAKSEYATDNIKYPNTDCITCRTSYSIGHICRGCNKRLFQCKKTEQYSASILAGKL